MKANTASTPVTFTVSTAEVLARRQSAMAHKGTSRDNTLDDLVVRALQVRGHAQSAPKAPCTHTRMWVLHP